MNKIKLYVIIPDISSGDYFNAKLRKQNIETEYDYYRIRPRVINNKLTTSKDVVEDMNKIFKTFKDKTRSVVIACNTLQLWLNDIDPKYKKNVKIYTTFEACQWQFNKLKIKPLWLGTTPLVERTNSFPTLLTYKEDNIQNKVQELIWRIKMIYGDDTSTAFDSVKEDIGISKKLQNKKINILKKEIISGLKKLNIKKVILGCTELPMVFKKNKEFGITFFDPAEILAKYVKAQSVILLFAGGTISSLARDDGALVGGHIFDLVERLIESMPGSLKHLNITKSDILYNGLSENINFSIQNIIWKGVKKALNSTPARIVISHGTDSIEQTARFLEKKLRAYKKKILTKIILTAANYPPNDPKTDAFKNLAYAISVVIPKSNKNFVNIAFQDRLVPSTEAVKEYYLGKPMAYISKSDMNFFKIKKQYLKKVANIISVLKKRISSKVSKKGILTYNVNVIRKNHNAFLKKINNTYCRVILFKLYHSGTANTIDRQASVSSLVEKLTKNGIICFGVTENGEPTDLHLYETSVKLLNSGLVPLYNMAFEVALAKLYLLDFARNGMSRIEIIDQMLKDYGGEIDQKLIRYQDIEKLKKMNLGGSSKVGLMMNDLVIKSNVDRI
jgi:L-asparaginase/Glu-tRNA(Gln) amidotransferase subunit D